MAVSLRARRGYRVDMEGRENDHEDVPRLPRRGEPVPPPWFERAERAAPPDSNEADPSLRLSWPRAIGLLALVLLIIGIPLEFAAAYFAVDAVSYTHLTLPTNREVEISVVAVSLTK